MVILLMNHCLSSDCRTKGPPQRKPERFSPPHWTRWPEISVHIVAERDPIGSTLRVEPCKVHHHQQPKTNPDRTRKRRLHLEFPEADGDRRAEGASGFGVERCERCRVRTLTDHLARVQKQNDTCAYFVFCGHVHQYTECTTFSASESRCWQSYKVATLPLRAEHRLSTRPGAIASLANSHTGKRKTDGRMRADSNK